VRRLPGVEEAVASDHGMLDGMYFEHFGPEIGRRATGILCTSPKASFEAVHLAGLLSNAGHFSGARGREFEEQDQRGTHRVIMVNEAMARK